MKKVLAVILVLVLLMSVVSGCSKPADNDGGEANGSETPVEGGKIVKVGLGHIASINKSKGAEDGEGALGQADVTVAAVGFDADGKVVSVTIDTAQTKVEFDEEGKITTDINATPKSKKELGFDYNMKKFFSEANGIGKEWFEQVEALEEWMVGKTVAEITGIGFKENAAGYTDAPDVAELESSVSISVTGYLEVVAEAWENSVEVKNGETVGLGLVTSVSKSKEAEDDEDALAQMDSTMTATAFDADGKVVGTIIDTVQIGVTFDADGQLTADLDKAIKTKHELKEDYGMKGVSAKTGIGKEWFEQMEAFQEWMIGKTVAEITGMKTKERDASHLHVPDVAELESSVTITVEGYLNIVDKAVKAAK